jgi:hypothetical protein
LQHFHSSSAGDLPGSPRTSKWGHLEDMFLGLMAWRCYLTLETALSKLSQRYHSLPPFGD